MLCGGSRDIVGLHKWDPAYCQRAVLRSDHTREVQYWAHSAEEGLCLSCTDSAVAARVPMPGYRIFHGTHTMPPSPPLPPPDWRPRPPPSPSPPPVPASPSPPLPPLVDGIVRSEALCTVSSSSYGLHGAGLDHPHFWGKFSAEACAAALDAGKYPFFSWSKDTGMCFACTRALAVANAHYSIYRTVHWQAKSGAHTVTKNKAPREHDAFLDEWARGESLAQNPFGLHMHPKEHGATGIRGAMGLPVLGESSGQGSGRRHQTRK